MGRLSEFAYDATSYRRTTCPWTSAVGPLALHDAREGWYRGLVVVLQVYTALQVAPSNVQ